MLRIKTYQDAIREAKKVLTALGIDFFSVHAEEWTYYGEVVDTFTEQDEKETVAHPGDHIKIQMSLCDLGSIENDLRASEFFDRCLNWLFTIVEGPP